MNSMFYGEYPPFDELMAAIEKIETEINILKIEKILFK